MMHLQDAPARITECPPKGREIAEGDSTRHVLKTDVKIVIDLTPAVFKAAEEALVPRLDDIATLVAGDEDHPGLTIDAHVELPVCAVTLEPRDPDNRKAKPAFSWNAAEPMGKPRFRINAKGEGTMTIKFRVTTTKADATAFVDFLDADVAIWIDQPDPTLAGKNDHPSQTTIGDEIAKSVDRVRDAGEALAKTTKSGTVTMSTTVGGKPAGKPVVFGLDDTAKDVLACLKKSKTPLRKAAIEELTGHGFRPVTARLQVLIQAKAVRTKSIDGATTFEAV